MRIRSFLSSTLGRFYSVPTTERSGRWEVNGKSSPEGDQAVLLPSEAAQGYLLPVRSAHAVDRVPC